MHKILSALSGVLLFLVAAAPAPAEDACTAPEPVCAARGNVYPIAAFNPAASAVRIDENMLVASRHAIADATEVAVTRKDGSTVTGQVLPSAYDGDLILIEVTGLADGQLLATVDDLSGDAMLYTVASERIEGPVRVYKPGRVLLLPNDAATHGRLHHTAHTQYGNSGGALVDGQGRLVGIVASGGEGRYEAIPARELERLRQLSGAGFAERSIEIGIAVRRCIELLDAPMRRVLADEVAADLHDTCAATQNRQYFDLAAQQLWVRRQWKLALDLSRKSVARDPHSVNARLILLTILHSMRRYEEEVPHIRFLMQHLPEEIQVHTYAIQVGKWTEDMELANAGLDLVKKHNPAQARAAEGFLKAEIPRPPPLE
jgi:hypothetical protein